MNNFYLASFFNFKFKYEKKSCDKRTFKVLYNKNLQTFKSVS